MFTCFWGMRELAKSSKEILSESESRGRNSGLISSCSTALSFLLCNAQLTSTCRASYDPIYNLLCRSVVHLCEEQSRSTVPIKLQFGRLGTSVMRPFRIQSVPDQGVKNSPPSHQKHSASTRISESLIRKCGALRKNKSRNRTNHRLGRRVVVHGSWEAGQVSDTLTCYPRAKTRLSSPGRNQNSQSPFT